MYIAPLINLPFGHWAMIPTPEEHIFVPKLLLCLSLVLLMTFCEDEGAPSLTVSVTNENQGHWQLRKKQAGCVTRPATHHQGQQIPRAYSTSNSVSEGPVQVRMANVTSTANAAAAATHSPTTNTNLRTPNGRPAPFHRGLSLQVKLY